MEATQHDHPDRTASGGHPPGRQDVASYRSYAAARQAVDRLAEHDFPLERVSIVGHGLNFVEQVTGRRGYPSAALSGAATGAAIGALFGFVAGLFNWVEPLVSALALGFYGLILGAVLGLIFGLISKALGGEDFNSIGGMQADHFDVVVDDDLVERARRVLDEAGHSRPDGHTPGTPARHPGTAVRTTD